MARLCSSRCADWGVLHGQPAVDHTRGHARPDEDLFRQWSLDLAEGSVERCRIVLLGIEARLSPGAHRAVRWRGAGYSGGWTGGRGRVVVRGERGGKAEGMARYIADHYAEPLRLADIAAAVALHPNYAMGLFRVTFGMSVVAYLTQYRVAVAQRLLATTDAPVLDIARGRVRVCQPLLHRLQSGVRESSRAYRAALWAP